MHAVATNTSTGVKRTHAAMAAPGGIKSIYEICAGFANGEVLVPKHFLQCRGGRSEPRSQTSLSLAMQASPTF